MTDDDKPCVLLVDDDDAVRIVLQALLEQGGFSVRAVESAPAALAILDSMPFDIVLSDVCMPGMDGMALLRELNVRHSELPVVLLTAHGSVPLAVEAMRAGAQDFLLKPFDREEVLYTLEKALLASSTSRSVRGLTTSSLIGDSPAMRELYALLGRVAGSPATVLVRGESGTGKELVARALHDQGPRRSGPFIKIHCGALPEALLESELFGFEKGAFTGAAHRKPGRIEHADRGTLFLDEIGDITQGVQVKLLRVLEERAFERLGGHETIAVDVRFVAATHQDLEAMVRAGTFREDLFYRLNVVPLRLPALRERPGDIERLAVHFASQHGADNGRSKISLSADALLALKEQPWPGNVRELENFMERLVLLSDNRLIDAGDVERELRRTTSPCAKSRTPSASGPLPSESERTLSERLRDVERDTLESVLQKAGNNRTLAARLLGISRRSLYKKLDLHGIA